MALQISKPFNYHSIITYLTIIIEWDWVWCEELCRSMRSL